MTISDLNPHIRYAGIHNTIIIKPYCSINYDCRLFYFKNITGMLYVGDSQYQITDGTAVYFPPETHYNYVVQKTDSSRILVFNFDLTREYDHIEKGFGTGDEYNFDADCVPRYELISELSQPIIINDPHLGDKMESCAAFFLGKSSYYTETSSSMLRLCLVEMLKNNESSNSNIPIVRAVKNYIRDNYSDPELSNNSIAAALNYHPYYLSRIMKTSTGVTLHQYILDYRIEASKNYLSTTDYDISHVAWMCGFGSTSHFIKLFRSKCGTTPYKYRKNNTDLNL